MSGPTDDSILLPHPPRCPAERLLVERIPEYYKKALKLAKYAFKYLIKKRREEHTRTLRQAPANSTGQENDVISSDVG